MPHITLNWTAEGLELSVLVGLSGKETARLLTAGLPIPRPLTLPGIIDTGSNITCVSVQALGRLGTPWLGSSVTQTPAGPHQVDLYEASLSIPLPGGAPTPFLFVLDQLVVMELQHTGSVVEVLLGRDVLAHLLCFLHGPRGEFTLTD
jgi:hypothetical protein